jgi:hypothetical protein
MQTLWEAIKIIYMQKKIVVEIDYAENIPDVSSRYVATINDETYKIVVSGKSITDCLDFNSKVVV